jgi:outer membrane biosynthesis protein TonB
MTSSTTSEFIIGHSPDDAADRKAEMRKILWALLAALVVHLVVGFSIASLNGLFASRVVPLEEDKPVELTIVDLPAQTQPAPQKNSMFMETDENKASAEPPKEKTFESNANSIAASQQPATGSAPLPSQEGKDRPNVDLESHSYSLATEGIQPQPSVAPQPSAQPSPTPQSTPVTASEQFAMLTNTPTPTPSVQPSVARTPAPVRTRYQPLKQQTRIAGAISNRGISSVNALGTPLGRYEKTMKDAIGSHWYAYMEQRKEMANVGTLQVHFIIDRNGHVQKLKITENTSNETFANICLQAILEAHLPPIPDDLAATLPPEGLEIEGMNFIIYPN